MARSSRSPSSTGYVSSWPSPTVPESIGKQLGLLGFLASETLMKDGTANAGLLDQRASFEWLQRHVASFGGDPSKITISVSLPSMCICLRLISLV
jgi:hypothetical protein